MLFNKHLGLTGHAFLSPSKYHWINYDDEKLDRTFIAAMAAQRGTELHAFAHEAIRLGIKQRGNRQTLSMYVNDAIGFGLTPEQPLVYSENAFGTADAIGFRANRLRIHDLKTGRIPASIHQLEVYAALFCLEYGFKPHQIQNELRIYQSNEIEVYEADPDDLVHIMDRIVTFDKRIKDMKREAAQ